jgi:hypothetical protein
MSCSKYEKSKKERVNAPVVWYGSWFLTSLCESSLPQLQHYTQQEQRLSTVACVTLINQAGHALANALSDPTDVRQPRGFVLRRKRG